MQTVSKWGNSLAVRIPAAFAESIGLAEGSEVELSVEDEKLVVAPKRALRYDVRELVAAITPRNRHALTDWGKPAGREIW